MNFIPSPRTASRIPILEAANRFGRNLKLAYFFKGARSGHRERFVHKSDWVPPDSKIPAAVKNTLVDIETELHSLETVREKQNLTHREREALRSLSQNSNIVIKPADKGSATVIMDKTAYLAEGYRQLSKENHYRKLDSPIFPDTAQKVQQVLDGLRDQPIYLSRKQFEFLQPPPNPDLGLCISSRKFTNHSKRGPHHLCHRVDRLLVTVVVNRMLSQNISIVFSSPSQSSMILM